MRHAWDKLDLHQYRCRRCGMDKTNSIAPEPDARGWAQWVAVFSRAGETWTGATPPCPGTLPEAPVPALDWTRIDRHVERAATGERVSADKDANGWKFCAWGADVAPGVRWSDWPPDARVHYPRGTPVPQRCALLGVFATAEEARAACAADRAGKEGSGFRVQGSGAAQASGSGTNRIIIGG